MGLGERLRHVGELLAVRLRVLPEEVESGVGVDAVAFHEDAFGLLDDRAASEGALEVAALLETIEVSARPTGRTPAS